VKLEVLDLHAFGVERANDLREVGLAGPQPNCDAASPGARLAETGDDRLGAFALVGVGRDDLDGRTAHLGLELRGRPLRDDVTVVDDPDAVREDIGLLQILRREEDRDAVVPCQPAHLVPEGRAALDIEPGRRLVEEENPRRMDEGKREVEAPLHPAGVAAHLAVGGLGEADALEEKLATRGALRAREALEGRLQPQMLTAGEQRVEGRLLERGADRCTDLRALADDVEPGHGRSARRRGEKRRQHVHRGRLAGAVRAEETEDLPRVDEQVDAVDRARTLLELPHQPARNDSVLVGHACRLVM
jgi:hypothetical protein